MKIYTRTGDKGETGIVGGRVLKSSMKVEAYGTIDEANSVLGVALAHVPDTEEEVRSELEHIQHELFDCGSDLSMQAEKASRYPFKVTEDMVFFLEERIDAYVAEAPDVEYFILPGGSVAAAHLHVVRTVVRRAERQVCRLAEEEKINPCVQKYLNRLSDYFFALARVLNARQAVPDVTYKRSGKVFRSIKKE